MLNRLWSYLLTPLLSVGLMLCSVGSASAQTINIFVPSQPGFSASSSLPGLRMMDFSTITLSGEESSGRISRTSDFNNTFLSCCGSFGITSSWFPPEYFAGNYAQLNSGSGDSWVQFNFANSGSHYVSFLWHADINDNDNQATIYFSNGTSRTIANCGSSSNSGCFAYYIPPDLWQDFLDLLLLNPKKTVRFEVIPAAGVRITAVRMRSYSALGISQAMAVDNFHYGDPMLHHVRVTTGASSSPAGANVTFTIEACANAACSTKFTSGISGTLVLTGGAVTYPSGQAFSIASGSSSTTIVARPEDAATYAVALSNLTPLPYSSPAVYCGMGAAASSSGSCNLTATPSLHHMEVTASSATGLTCQPTTFTIKACGNASCSTLYTTGVTGTLALTGAGMTVNYPSGAGFSIGVSGQTTVQAHITTAGTVTASLTGLSVAPVSTPTLYCGMGVAAASGGSCAYTAAAAGLFFDVAHHVAGVQQTGVTVSAVRASDNALQCVPAFAGVTRNVTFRCAYSNPTTGTLPVRVGGTALNSGNSTAAACDAGGRSVSLNFNASGVATTTVDYADAGQMSLTATYTGSGSEAGLVMTGADTFVAAPASFAFSGVTAGPIRAGRTFGATVTARNQAGVATPNFGREISPAAVALSFIRRQPTGTGAQNGTFSGSLGAFSSGVATASNLSWSEVGNADLTATSSNYLSSGLSISGSTGSGPAGAVGPFIPNHFTVAVSQACPAGTPSFTYSGQPFTMTVTAHNATGGITENYDGTANTSPNFAKAVTLSAATNASLGSLGSAGLAASAFARGVGTLSTQSFTFTNKLTAPATVNLRAVDSDGVSSAGQSEGAVSLRSGRLRLFNKFGSEKAALSVPLQAHYWSGKAWVINSADSCTQITTGSVVRAQYLDHKGAPTTAWSSSPATDVTLSAGQGALIMSAPTGGATGTVALAINLGSTATDQSCLSQHPASTGLNRPWLRSINGSCATTHDRDPSARATFGIFKPETHRAVHVREIY